MLIEGEGEWAEKVRQMETEMEQQRKTREAEKDQNKELLDQLNIFEEDKQQFMLKIQELEEDNIRLMKYGPRAFYDPFILSHIFSYLPYYIGK